MLDVALGTILVVSVIAAAWNGITKEAFRIASLIVGIMTAMWGHGLLAVQLRPWIEDGRVAAGIAFVSIFLGCLLAGALLGHFLASVWSWTGLRWLDMLLGGCLGIVRGVLICAVVLIGLLVFQPFAGASSMVAHSRIAPWVINMAHTAIAVAPSGMREAFGMGAAEADEMRKDGDPREKHAHSE